MYEKILCFGEILLRLNPPNNQRLAQTSLLEVQFAGSEANVAVALAQLGLKSSFVTCVPDNEVGRMSLGSLKRYDVDTDLSVFSGERLGLFYLEMGIGQRATKVVYDRAHSSMVTIKKGQIDWHNVLKNATWFHWSGITPAISQAAADATLNALKVAKFLNIPISCDLNFRSNLWQYGKKPSEIMPQLVQFCSLIVGDGDTIGSYFNIFEKDYASLSEKTFRVFPNLTHIALTARKAHHASFNTYQGFLHNKTSFFTSKEYEIADILDRLGTGDAFTAGLIYALVKKDAQYAVEFATATATLKHTIYGDYNLITAAEVEALMNGNTGGKVLR